MDKRTLGQYFTITNPFKTNAFFAWKKELPESKIVEPFAGSNNIPKMLIRDDVLPNYKWDCFDIDASHSTKEYPVIERDTINNFPTGYKICITNPPYLSKNSATRRHLDFPKTKYDDLYKLCLEKMLENCEYVAAIIPETFITSGEFTERLKSVISLSCKMFDDTDCPVCLALFVKDKTKDFQIWRINELLGNYKELKKHDIVSNINNNWKINDPNGEIGIWCIDGTKEESIHFGKGDLIDSKKIKISSRSLTRVSGLPKDIDFDKFIDKCNEILKRYRKETKDVFMASFKGLRQDGLYRRRLDFATAKNIMNLAIEELTKSVQKVNEQLTLYSGGPDYEGVRKARLAENVANLKTLVKNKDKNMMEKINNYAKKFDLDPEFIEYEILHDSNILITNQFVVDPAKQTIDQQTCFEFIKTIPYVKNIKLLPAGGENALYIKNGKLGTRNDLDKGNSKSIDLYFEYKNKQYYCALKYTKDNGGAQDNQCDDAEDFLENASKSNDENIRYLAILDGPYYERPYTRVKNEYKTKIEYLNSLYKTKSSRCITSKDLAGYLQEEGDK